MRLIVTLCLCFFMAGRALAEPAAQWRFTGLAAAPWASTISREVQAYGHLRRPTALMVVQGDRVITQWGDVARRVNLRSVRKSLISALYGVAVAEGRIRPSSTLAEFGIDDVPPGLTAVEKQATVRDLLTARSGVYHPAASETSDIRQKRPARGSHAAGTFWFYNNWDFNALGTIYRKATGEDIFQSFSSRIAGPIGMEDYSPRDGRYVREASSMHAAYPFSLSARDLARFGLLYLKSGRWNGVEIVPAKWVAESTATYSQTDRAGRGYGYLWWTLPGAEWGQNAFMASGYGGQIVLVVPTKHLVIVETVEMGGHAATGVRTSAFLDLARSIVSDAP